MPNQSDASGPNTALRVGVGSGSGLLFPINPVTTNPRPHPRAAEGGPQCRYMLRRYCPPHLEQRIRDLPA